MKHRDAEIEPNAPDWLREPASDTLLSDWIWERLQLDAPAMREKIEMRRLEDEPWWQEEEESDPFEESS
jgi:hypothetical protein